MAINHIPTFYTIIMICKATNGRPIAPVAVHSSGFVQDVTENQSTGFYSFSTNCSQDLGNLRLLTTAVPDLKLAKKFARELVEQERAAIVNILPTSSTVYRWNGKLVQNSEILLLIYTQSAAIPGVLRYVRENSPDKEPGLVALPIVGGSNTFMSWLEINSSNGLS